MNSSNPYGSPVSDAELEALKAVAGPTPHNSRERGAVEMAIASRRHAADAARVARREATAKARNEARRCTS